jgi:hypothetical protein
VTWALLKLLILREFGAQIFLSGLIFWVLSVVGICSSSSVYPLRSIGILWLIGAAVSAYAQGTAIPIHFIPMALPLALLSGIGLASLGENAVFTSEVLLGFVLLARLRFFFKKREGLDRALWPSNYLSLVEKNLASARLAPLIKSRTSANDFILVWGTVPQLYVQSERRCPVGWLMTNELRMDLILPDWKKILFKKMSETKPLLIIDFEGSAELAEIKEQTGLSYEEDRSFSASPFLAYKLVTH